MGRPDGCRAGGVLPSRGRARLRRRRCARRRPGCEATMNSKRSGASGVVAVVTLLLSLPGPGRSEESTLGIVVEAIPPATPASRSGLQMGDVLQIWLRHDEAGNVLSQGAFASPFDALSVFL